jgi:hypothetical protein
MSALAARWWYCVADRFVAWGQRLDAWIFELEQEIFDGSHH